MKLAFSLFRYFPFGGLQRDFMRILLEARDRGHDIEVYTSAWHGVRPDGIQVHELRCRGWTNHRRNAAFARRLGAHLRESRFDAVVGFDKMPGLDIYYGADTCYVARAHITHGLAYRLTPRYRCLHHLERAVFGIGSKTRILSLTQAEKDIYQRFYFTPDDRFSLLPPTLDPARCLGADRARTRPEVRRELALENEDLLVLFVGSSFKTKGLDRALRAVAALPQQLLARTRLVVVGEDGPGRFARLVRHLSITERVEFLGGREDVPRLLQAGDLLVHPARSESAGAVLLESLAAGLPVLTTDICGYAFHVERARGGVVLPSPFSQRLLNDRLGYMLLASERTDWSHNGIEYAKDPTLCSMPPRAMDIIEQSAKAKAQPRRHTSQGAGTRCLYLHDDLRRALCGHDSFEQLMSIAGDVFRETPARRTLRFERDGRAYFLKAHTGVGWAEILKNLIYLRLPVVGAANEWHGIHRLRQLGVDTPTITAYGSRGVNPARRRSFIVTEELAASVSLEKFCGRWMTEPPQGPEEVRLKRWLIARVADISRIMHANGANHRDYYLCHFLLEPSASRLYLMDMHRMQLRRTTPSRWMVKDLAGLYFSAMDIGLTQRDLLRFVYRYRDRPLRDILRTESRFWSTVSERARALYRSQERRQARRRSVAGTRAAPSA